MSWDYAGRVRYGEELVALGPFRLKEEEVPQTSMTNPAMKIITLHLKDGSKVNLTTFPSTIGEIVRAGALKGFVECFSEVGTDRTGKEKTYYNFHSVKEAKK